MSNFKIGDRVVQKFIKYNYEEDDTVRGEVVGHNPKNGKLLVQTIDWRDQAKIEEWDPGSVISEADAEVKLSNLEKEWDVIATQVNKKFNEAVASLQEANRMANDKGYNLRELGLSFRSVKNALYDGGWSRSSMSC